MSGAGGGRGFGMVRPRTANQLHAWLRGALGVRVPRRALLDGSDAPFAYLCHAFFEDGEREAAGVSGDAGDAVVWAARGGGKTFYAAVATVLDLVFKPGVEVKILGGSLEQSRRMHEHLRVLFEREEVRGLLDWGCGTPITERRVRLANGSRAEVLAQSHTSVRGTRPHKLRCDELDLFDPGVWEAAQLTTRSGVVETGEGKLRVGGSIEALSTYHRAGGLMGSLVKDGEEGRRRVFRWTVVDVLEACGAEHVCDSCGILGECGGRAKVVGGAERDVMPRGHVGVSDALRAKGRAGAAAWKSEMMCAEPDRTDAVVPEFDAGVHVSDVVPAFRDPVLVGGMDFGLRSPTVVVFALVEGASGVADGGGGGGAGWMPRLGAVHVVGEHVASEMLLGEHVRAIEGWVARLGRGLRWIGVDPAGHQRNDQTGVSPVRLLERAGMRVRTRRTGVEAGLRLLRARLGPALRGLDGRPLLTVDPSCGCLIGSLAAYRYGRGGGVGGAVKPMKDGPDHAVDALRYLLVNLEAGGEVTVRRYV